MRSRAYLYLTAAALLWAGNVVAGKLVVGHVSPLLLTWMRWTAAFLLLLAFGWRHLRSDWPVVRANLAYLSLMGVLAMGVFNALLYVSLNYTTAVNVSILQAAIPMVVFAVNFLAYRERTGLAQLLGFVLTLAGVLLIAGEGSLARLRSLQVNFGDLLMVSAVILYGGYIVALRRMPRIHWQSMMTVMFAAAAATTFVFALGEIAAGQAIAPDLVGVLVTLYAAIFPSIASQTLMVVGTELIGANRAGLFVNLVPLFGTLMAVVLLGEAFLPYHAAALVLVLSGIALSERFRRGRAA